MTNKSEIELTVIQVESLLDEELKKNLHYILKNGVYCATCQKICEEGVSVEKVSLNNLNDIKIQGKCNACNGKVTRIVEFGEDNNFYILANEFKQAIVN